MLQRQFGIIGTLDDGRKFCLPFPIGTIGQVAVNRVIPFAKDARMGFAEYSEEFGRAKVFIFAGRFVDKFVK